MRYLWLLSFSVYLRLDEYSKNHASKHLQDGVPVHARTNFSIYAALLRVARVRVAPPRDGLAGHDVLDELLARQPRVGAWVRLLRAQPGRDGLPLVGLPGAGGDLHERGAASLKPHCAPSVLVNRSFPRHEVDGR